MLIKAQLNGKLPPVKALISVKWGAKHTDSQRGFYFVFLQWLIDVDLKSKGHYTTYALHENLKKALKEESIADFNKMEMGDWMDKVVEFAEDFFEIDTKPFFEDYRKNYQP